jgi:hypothetical protein
MGGGRGRFRRPLKKFPAREKRKKKKVSSEGQKQSIAGDGKRKKERQ